MSYYDYFFLLEPSDNIKCAVKTYKSLAGDIIGPYPGMNATAHLSLMIKPRQKSHFLKSYLENVRHKIMHTPAIELQVDGFGTFKAVKEGEILMTIYAQIKGTYKSDNWFDTLGRQLGFKLPIPHITITKVMPVDSYVKLWPHFKYRGYQDSFIANKLTILQRESYTSSAKWQPYEEIPFRKSVIDEQMVA